MLGTLLLEDNDGSIMPAISSQFYLDAERITMEIMRRWLGGRGKQPVTWRTLTQCLSSIGLSALASSIEPAQPSVCPEIRDMLLDAVDSAASAFRFKNSRASVAFQCPCDPDDAHTGTPNEARSNLVCSLTGEVCEGPLTPAQRVWLGATTTPGECVCIVHCVVYV